MTQAQVQVSVNGGAWQSGGVLGVPFLATLNFQNATSSGVRSYLWELLDYPPGLSVPAGWTSVNGVYTYGAAASPPQITLPAGSATTWGKIAVRLRLNGNPLQFDATGALQQAFVSTLTDTATMLSISSPGAALPGFAFSEAFQYDQQRSWPGAIMANLRAVDTAIASLASVATTGGASTVATPASVVETSGLLGSAATINLQPTVGRVVALYNNNTGGFTTTFQPVGGTGFSVAQTKRAFGYVNGSGNLVRVSPDT